MKQKKCSVEGCDNPVEAKGLCRKHYQRWKKYGDVNYRQNNRDGLYYTQMPEYEVWSSMKSRCNNPDNIQYKNYGGRAVKICKRWENSFPNFLTDMGKKPTPKHQIDRINNDGDYTPENCRWVTLEENANNKRNNRKITYNGETKTYAQWSRELGGNKSLVSWRIGNGWGEQDAVSTPVEYRRSKEGIVFNPTLNY